MVDADNVEDREGFKFFLLSLKFRRYFGSHDCPLIFFNSTTSFFVLSSSSLKSVCRSLTEDCCYQWHLNIRSLPSCSSRGLSDSLIAGRPTSYALTLLASRKAYITGQIQILNHSVVDSRFVYSDHSPFTSILPVA